MDDTTQHQSLPQMPTLRGREKEDKERRAGGAPLSFWERTTGVRLAGGEGALGAGQAGLELGGSSLGSGFSSITWGAAGRAELWSLLKLLATRCFTPEQLALMAVGALSIVALCVLGLSTLLNSSADGSARVWGWHPDRPADAFGASAGAPQEPPRPAMRDLLADAPLQEAAPPEGKPAAPADAPAPAAPPQTPPVPEQKAETAPPEVWGGTLLRSPSLFDAKPGLTGGGAFLRDSLAPLSAASLAGASAAGAAGRLSPPDRGPLRASARNLGTVSAHAGRAIGQLKFADGLSRAAQSFSAGDLARQYAADAFDQGLTKGGGAGVIGGTQDVSPLGSGAPDVTQQPDIGPTQNLTPYQNQADQAQQNNDMAMVLTILGGVLMALGAVLAKQGKSMMSNPMTMTQGKQLMALGIALLLAGVGALVAGLVMSQQGKDKGNNIGKQYGQPAQGNVIESCANQAVRPQHCRPPAVNIPGDSVHQDVVAESNAGFDLQGGGRPIRR